MISSIPGSIIRWQAREIPCVFLTAVLCLLTVLQGCGANRAAGIQGREAESFSFKRLVVLPFERREGLFCRSDGQAVLSCRVEPEAESYLNKLLMDYFRKMPGVELVSQEEINKVILDLSEPERTQMQISGDFALQVAKKLDADAVIQGFVFCYRERVGNAAAASEPAAVSFHLHLYRADSGEMVWTGGYEEEQVSLSENILKAGDFFRRGAKWVMVEELARDGMARAMSVFPAPGGDVR